MNCPECGRPMRKIAESWVDKDGNRWISYSCPFCHTVIKVKE